LTSAIAKDVGASEVDALTSVIELHEHGYLKIPMTDGKVDLVPCIPGARPLAEVLHAGQVAAPRRITRPRRKPRRRGESRRGSGRTCRRAEHHFFARSTILARALQKESPAVKRGQIKLFA
jgi:hypothetical protein